MPQRVEELVGYAIGHVGATIAASNVRTAIVGIFVEAVAQIVAVILINAKRRWAALALFSG